MKVKLSDIIGTIEMTDQDSDYFLDKETGEILWANSEVMENEELEEIDNYLEEHDCCRLPSSYEINNYSIILRFRIISLHENSDNMLFLIEFANDLATVFQHDFHCGYIAFHRK